MCSVHAELSASWRVVCCIITSMLYAGWAKCRMKSSVLRVTSAVRGRNMDKLAVEGQDNVKSCWELSQAGPLHELLQGTQQLLRFCLILQKHTTQKTHNDWTANMTFWHWTNQTLHNQHGDVAEPSYWPDRFLQRHKTLCYRSSTHPWLMWSSIGAMEMRVLM